MTPTEKAVCEILKDTEDRLRELIAAAARLGDYDGIDVARAVAGRVRDIASEHASSATTNVCELNANGATSAATSVATASPRDRRRIRGEYPRFAVEAGVLHKVGWSKKDRQEYVHKVPKEAYELVLRGIGDSSHSRKGPFSSDELVKRLQSREPVVPAYQVYVTLALLRSRKIVEKKGREGYLSAGDIVPRGLRVWSDLESQKGKSH